MIELNKQIEESRGIFKYSLNNDKTDMEKYIEQTNNNLERMKERQNNKLSKREMHKAVDNVVGKVLRVLKLVFKQH